MEDSCRGASGRQSNSVMDDQNKSSMGDELVHGRESASRRRRRVEILAQASLRINEVLEIPAIMRALVEAALEATGATGGTAGLMVDGKMVFTEYHRGGEWLAISYTFDLDRGVPGWVMRHKQSYLSNNTQNDPQVVPEIRAALGFYNLANTPILSRHGELLGCFEIHNTADRRPFDTQDIAVLHGLAVNAAVALENARILDESRQSEQRLKASEQRFRDVVNASGEYVWEVDAEGRFTYVSERAESVLGYSEAELLGHTPYEFMPEDEAKRVREWLRENAQNQPFRGLEHKSRTHSGDFICQQVSGVPILDGDGKVVGYRGTASDISERKRAEERIEYLATRDTLTDLPNRLLLNDRLNQGIGNAQRGQEMLAVLFVDLDRFKTVNDSLGHHIGDEVLKQVAERLIGCTRKVDTLARLGGDEFVVVVGGLAHADEVELVAQKIIKAVSVPYTVEGYSLNNISCSVGIALYPDDGEDARILLRNADTAMYHAKESGRKTYQFFSSEMNARALERLTLENALRRALERQEFELYYQPQVDMASGRILGMEALLRWHHPEKGLIGPTSFIHIAEETGLIGPIGEWILHTACARNSAWARMGYPPLRVAVNLSVSQINKGIVNVIAKAIDAAGLDPECLGLEITESLLLHNVEENIEILDRIGALGAHISIDDFGTGYSSLSYLQRFPIDMLKIPLPFVRDVATNPDDAAIVRAIIAMAKNLNLRVLGEGVEEESQLSLLRDMECDEYQGYFFSRPLAAGEFERQFLRLQS